MPSVFAVLWLMASSAGVKRSLNSLAGVTPFLLEQFGNNDYNRNALNNRLYKSFSSPFFALQANMEQISIL